LLIIIINLYLVSSQNMAELLGYPKETRLLIINADDYGMCNAENMGTERVLEYGLTKSTTIMTVCPWALGAIDYIKRMNFKAVGVHVALTSEWGRYRWRPINTTNHHSSLVDPTTSFMWRTSQEVERNAKINEFHNEIVSQLNQANKWLSPMELAHFDSHMGSFYGIETLRLEFMAHVFSISYEFGLPFRIPMIDLFKPILLEFRKLGFPILDALSPFGRSPPGEPNERKRWYMNEIKNIKPGLTELYIHPAINNEELRAVTASAQSRQLDTNIFCDPDVRDLIRSENITLIDFLLLKVYQREKNEME